MKRDAALTVAALLVLFAASTTLDAQQTRADCLQSCNTEANDCNQRASDAASSCDAQAVASRDSCVAPFATARDQCFAGCSCNSDDIDPAARRMCEDGCRFDYNSGTQPCFSQYDSDHAACSQRLANNQNVCQNRFTSCVDGCPQ